jgi:metal-responsive CopG/Arc/MetJ family transcriptional regulator
MVLYLCGGDYVAIAESKTRTQLTLPKELKAELEDMAKDERRSFNNLVVKILEDYVSENKRK